MMKKLGSAMLVLAALYMAPATAMIYSYPLDEENICPYIKQVHIEAGDTVSFLSYLALGDLLVVHSKVSNSSVELQATEQQKQAQYKKLRWQFVNHNRKRFNRRYSQGFETKIRIGSYPGSFKMYYSHFGIPKGNIITFTITDKTYCKKIAAEQKLATEAGHSSGKEINY